MIFVLSAEDICLSTSTENITAMIVEQKTNMKYRFHLLGLVHLPQATRYTGCAFTQKNLKLAKMLTAAGHEVFFYGSEGSDVEAYCNSPLLHFVQTHTLSDIRRDWGDGDNRFEIGYDHSTGGFRNDFNTQPKPVTEKYFATVIQHINSIKKPDDFLLITQGRYQEKVAKGVNLLLTVEPGIGYRGGWTKYRAFESSYIQNFTYGSEHPRESINGESYDRVIPNYFDISQFELAKKKKDYYLFVGRLINRKGVWTAIETTKALGKKLILAGQSDPEISLSLLPKNCEYVGVVGTEERKKLMSEALAVFVPSLYLEPFAGVHIEAMLSGTPPITTNFGVFPETIPDHLNGKVGFRCDIFRDFVEAAKQAPLTNPKEIRKYAERFSMENVWLDYQKWFDDLYMIYENQVDPNKKAWHRL